MSNEQHTQGRLADDLSEHDVPYQDIRLKIGNRTVCVVYIDDAPVHDYNAEQLANARRLVACWNACEGIGTLQLESLRFPLLELHKKELDLQVQRDELLAALEEVLAAERFSNRPPETVMQAEAKLDRIRKAAARAEAAIAKVKGGAA